MLTGDLTNLHSVKSPQECQQSPSLGLLFPAHRHVRATCILTGLFGRHSALKIGVLHSETRQQTAVCAAERRALIRSEPEDRRAESHPGNSTREVNIRTERLTGCGAAGPSVNRTSSGIRAIGQAAGDEHHQVCLMRTKLNNFSERLEGF